MIKMLTASTLEVDDRAYALEEILSQLKLEENLLAHSAGILMCYPDFMETGVAQYIAENLPFDVVGGTTVATMTDGASDAFMLTVCVFTGDTVRFGAFSAQPQPGADAIGRAYQDALANEGEPPRMIVPFVPTSAETDGQLEVTVRALVDAVGDVPLFGTIVADHTQDRSRCATLFNAQASQTALTALLFFGDIAPTFCFSEISEKYVQNHRFSITESKENLVREVNGMRFTQYLKTLGIDCDDGNVAFEAVPFLVDFGDGSKPIARAVYAITEEGYGIFSGDMPTGATLAIGSIEYSDILSLTGATTKAALAAEKRNGVLLFSCISYFLALGADVQLQRETVQALMPAGLSYQLNYSGGEICPVWDDRGGLHNRLHSFTFTACIF
jgi:hypothetical protein